MQKTKVTKTKRKKLYCLPCRAPLDKHGRCPVCMKLRVNPFKIHRGLIEEGYPDYETKKYRGSTREVDLVLPDIATAHEVARLAGIKTYAIADEHDTFVREPAFKTDDMLDYEAKSKIAREKHKMEQHAKVEKISKTPTGHIIARYGRVVIYAKRKKPVYNETRTQEIQVYDDLLIARPGKRAMSLDIDDYFKGGKYDKKKFLNRFSYFFGGEESHRAMSSRYSSQYHRHTEGRPSKPGVYPEPLPTIANDLPEIRRKYHEFVRTNWRNPIRGSSRKSSIKKSSAGLIIAGLAVAGLLYANRGK